MASNGNARKERATVAEITFDNHVADTNRS